MITTITNNRVMPNAYGRWVGTLVLVMILLVPTLTFAKQDGSLLYRSAPELRGTATNGAEFDLADYRGKWVLVDFWATWCKPCLAELPNVIALSKDTQSRNDFAVLSVSLDSPKTRERLADVASKESIPYPVLYDGLSWQGEIALTWAVRAIPATFLIDPAGIVVSTSIKPPYVSAFLNKGEQPGFDLLAMLATEHLLLPDSPSTGHPGFRDLEVSIPLGELPGAVAIRLDVESRAGEPGGWVPLLPRHIVVGLNPDEAGFPYLVEFVDVPSPEATEGNGAELPATFLSARIDLARSTLVLVLPVPGTVSEVTYRLVGSTSPFRGYPFTPQERTIAIRGG